MAETMNPFEATFDLLQSLRDEINELRLALVEEQQVRAKETGECRQLMEEARYARNTKFEEVCNTVDELRQAKNARFDKIEAEAIDVRNWMKGQFESLDQKIEAEIDQREVACCTLDKTITFEVAQLQHFDRNVALEVEQHRRLAELFQASVESKHQGLRVEVDKLAAVLRNNSMTRDPHKHFNTRPGRATVAPSVPARPGYKSTSPAATLFDQDRPDSTREATSRLPASPPQRGNQLAPDSKDGNPQSPGLATTLPELSTPRK
jgi:hypothetical protein